MKTKLRRLAAFAALALLSTLNSQLSTALAGSHTWSGAVNGFWSNPANWSSGGVPVAGEANLVLRFPSAPVTRFTSNNIVGLTVQSMIFSDTYTLRGNGVTMTSAGIGVNFIMSGSSDTATIDLPVALPAGSYSVSVGANAWLDFEGAITGPGALHKYGIGNLLITGNSPNTFSGGFYAHLGRVRLVKASGVALAGPVYVGDTNSYDEVDVEYGSHHQIADTAAVHVAGRDAMLDLDGYNDTFHSLTVADGKVSTGGFYTNGVLRLNGDLRSAQEDGSGNWVPMIFGRLNLGNVAHNFHVPTNTSLYLYAEIESTGIVGGINLQGGGYVLLAGSNSFGGSFRVMAGTVKVDHPHALGVAAMGTSLEGGRLVIDDLRHTFLEPLLVKATNSIVHCYGTNTWNGIIQIDPGAGLTLYGPSYGTPDVFNLGGTITGAGDLHISSLETDITGSVGNTLSGRTEIRGNSVVRMNKTSGHALSSSVIHMTGGSVQPQLRWKRDNQIPDTTRIEFPASSTASGELYLENHNDTIGSLDNGWDATISCGTGTLTIGGDNLDGDYYGSIFGNAGTTNLIKIGTGAFKLSGNHSLVGKTMVNSGTLILDNAGGIGPVHVANNARLAGHGILAALTVGPTASITPGTSLGGSSYGRLQSGSFNLGGGYLGMQLGGIHPGSSHDQIVVTAPVNLNGVLLLLSAQNLPHGSNSFTLIDVINGALTGEFIGLPEGTVFPSSDGKSFRITYHGGNGNDVVVTRHYTGPIGGQISGVNQLPDGRIQINGTGLPALSYRVHATTNFAPGNWIDIGSADADPDSGIIEFIDSGATNFPHRFYRFMIQ